MSAVNYIQTNALLVAERYIGRVRERPGVPDHPLIVWWHGLTAGGETPDEVPWCSSFVNGVCFELGLERSRSKGARTWLAVGEPIDIDDAVIGLDVVILKRGNGPQPGAAVLNAPGHVGFFAGWDDSRLERAVLVVGGNQGNAVSEARYPLDSILGIRRWKVES